MEQSVDQSVSQKISLPGARQERIKDITLPVLPLPPIKDLDYAHRGVAELRTLLSSKEFRESYIHEQGRPEAELIARVFREVDRQIHVILNRSIAREITWDYLRSRCETDDCETAKEYVKASVENRYRWWKTRKSLRWVQFTLDGEVYGADLQQKREFSDKLRNYIFSKRPELRAMLRDAEGLREEKQQESVKHLDRLERDLAAYAEDPRLLAAMDLWGLSPNAAGDMGQNRRGYHAGVIHFFKYRTIPEKALRFKNDPPDCFSISGFIQHSAYYHNLLSEAEMGMVPEALIISDREGRKRVITQDGILLVIGFKYPGERLRILTAFPTDPERLKTQRDLTLAQELNPLKDGRRYNQLGPRRYVVEPII